jgi:glycerophosphoryl diester phosphodiesterase
LNCPVCKQEGPSAMIRTLAAIGLLAASLAACQTASVPSTGAVADLPRPLVIAHRGASGLRPEHTLEAYALALDQGADCIEPDLVMTKDGVLIARHDTYLSTTTDIASRPEFASRKRVSSDTEFPGREDWWAADFTLAEIKTLRAIQSFRGRSKAFDGQFGIATFDEVLALAKSRKTASGHAVCVYPEAKSPAYHASRSLPMAKPILASLKKAGLDTAGSPIFIQTFEPDFAKEMDPLTPLPVVMLAGDTAALDAAKAMPGAPFWQGEGVTHPMLFKADGTSSGLIEAAHARGIQVHAWTYRDDVPTPGGGSVEDAINKALDIGLDGFFTDFPATGVKVVQEFKAATPRP